MDVVERAKRILLQPAKEWQAIAGEPVGTQALYTGYIAPLAAIGPVASIVGMSLVGVSIPFVGRYRVPLDTAVGHSLVTYLLTLVGVYLVALIVDALAPSFGGVRDRQQALKVVAYSSTPSWVAGIFSLAPALGILGLLLSLYSVYLLYLGLPPLMRVPHERSVACTAAVVACAVVLFFVFGLIGNLFVPEPDLPELPGQ